jgi:hypothetical protein
MNTIRCCAEEEEEEDDDDDAAVDDSAAVGLCLAKGDTSGLGDTCRRNSRATWGGNFCNTLLPLILLFGCCHLII